MTFETLEYKQNAICLYGSWRHLRHGVQRRGCPPSLKLRRDKEPRPPGRFYTGTLAEQTLGPPTTMACFFHLHHGAKGLVALPIDCAFPQARRRRRVSPPYQDVMYRSTGTTVRTEPRPPVRLSRGTLAEQTLGPPCFVLPLSHETQRRQNLVQFLCGCLHFMKVKLSCLHIMKNLLSAGKLKGRQEAYSWRPGIRLGDDYIILPTCWMNSMRLAASSSACLKSSAACSGLAFWRSL